MQDIVEILGPEQPVVLARELTKIHEEFIRGRQQRYWPGRRRRS